jgi:hypothetical protein
VKRARAARFAALSIGLAAALGLTGCGMSLPFVSSKPAVPCPSAVILRPLANTAIFDPGATARRPDNVAFYGLLSEVDAKCDYVGDRVRETLDVIVIGERGPAAHADSADFTYFLAVVGPGQAVLSKKSFSVHIAIPPGQKRSGVTDHIQEAIPLAGHAGADVNLRLGFQQTPEVIDFYKHFRGR